MRRPPHLPAYLGDKSWWLQYRPPRDQAPSANAIDRSSTRSGIGAAAVEPGAGVSTPHATMQAAGPRKAMFWQILRTVVSFMPFSTNPSAMGPTRGIMAVMAR